MIFEECYSPQWHVRGNLSYVRVTYHPMKIIIEGDKFQEKKKLERWKTENETLMN